MSNQRKQIIINEITFWKQNKLLPEHYCDFLMTLYTEGELNDELVGSAKNAVKAKENRKTRLWMFFIPIISILLVVASFLISSLMIIAIPAILFALVLVIVGVKLLKSHEILAPIMHLSAALVILAISLNVCLTYFEGNNIALYVTLLVNCALWMIAGIGMRLTYFTVAGGFGILAILIYGGMQG